MELVTGAMASLLPKLAELLHEEYKLQTSVKKDIEFLEREMKSMHIALRKVARVPRDQLDEQVKIWAGDVRELSYKMEDVVDSFLVRVEGSTPTVDPDSFKGLLEKMTNLFKKGKIRHQITDAVKDIRDQVLEVAARRDRYKVDDAVANPAASTTVDPRMLALFKDQRELVGIDEPRDELIKRLTKRDVNVSNSSQPLKMLSIFGFGGLGKTTLAKAVYDRLQPEFVRKAFVSMGQNPSIKKVLMDILLELDKDSHSNATTLDEKQLLQKLRRLLENKRYLIVIDDIWDIKSWEIIKCAWIDSNCGSIIITTTRILQVAKEITNHVYKHKPLSDDKSRELFLKRLYIRKHKHFCDQSAEISEKILQKCDGVPLAIITMASLLANKPRDDWSEVYESIGFGDEDNMDVDFMRKILLYSYYDLPCYLRTCLLHLTIYPEDSLIDKHRLIWKWVAEGFIVNEKRGGVGLFETGEKYFKELIDRSMIQPVEKPHEGIVYACHVHDMVLDMIISLSKEENFVVILGSDEQKYTCPKSNIRRLTIQNRVINRDDPLANTKMPQLRSFNTFACSVEIMPLLSSFHSLRVLDLRGYSFTEDHPYHLEHLGKLLQLRYLVLGMNITELPSEIGNLKFLQTLDLIWTRIKELPPSVGLLSQLKCLHLSSDFPKMLDRIENLPSSLEELWIFAASSEFVKDQLDKLTELRELRITFHSLDAELFNDLMTRLGNLPKLKVIDVSFSWRRHYDELNTDREDYMDSRQLRQLCLDNIVFTWLPVWVDPWRLPHLTHLDLKVQTMEAEDMEILGSFPALILLRLHTENHVTFLEVVGGGAFPKLRYLEVPAMLRFLQGAMPCLEYLSYHIERSARSRLWLPAYDDDSLNSDVATIRNLPACLQKVTVILNSDHVKTEKMARFAVEMHSARPTLEIIHSGTQSWF